MMGWIGKFERDKQSLVHHGRSYTRIEMEIASLDLISGHNGRKAPKHRVEQYVEVQAAHTIGMRISPFV